MSLIEDDKTNGSSFIWTIHNFDCCFHKHGEFLASPVFVLNADDDDKWRLLIYPRGIIEEDCITLALQCLRSNSIFPFETQVKYALSIGNKREVFKKRKNKATFFSTDHKMCRFQEILTRRELHDEGPFSYLDDGTITLRCRIWEIDGTILTYGQCHARTVINVEKTTNIWSFNSIRQLLSSTKVAAEEKPISSETPCHVPMKAILSRVGFLYKDGIKVEIKFTDPEKFLTCELTLLESADNKIVHSVSQEHWFDSSKASPVWTSACIPMSRLYNCKEPYLRCKLVVSSKVAYSKVEKVEYSNIFNTNIAHQAGHWKLNKTWNSDDSWVEGMQYLFINGNFSDITIHTTKKVYRVHKAVLCARSPVFAYMFDREMKDNKVGSVEIFDIEDDIFHRMLLFVYTNIIKELDWDGTMKLYTAADQYRIFDLRRKCSDFLMENISASECCEVLTLASVSLDEHLDWFAQNYFLNHAAEVMCSEGWIKLMQERRDLATKLIHMLPKPNLKV